MDRNSLFKSPDIAVNNVGTSENGNPAGMVSVFYHSTTVEKLLDIYINKGLPEYLIGSSVGSAEFFGESPKSTQGRIRISHNFRMESMIPYIFDVDVKQTAWDYGDGSGKILVEPLNGPLSGYIRVDLKETSDEAEVPGVWATWDLSTIEIKACRFTHDLFYIAEKVIEKVPFSSYFTPFTLIAFYTLRKPPITLSAAAIIYYALKIPPSLAEHEYRKRINKKPPF